MWLLVADAECEGLKKARLSTGRDMIPEALASDTPLKKL